MKVSSSTNGGNHQMIENIAVSTNKSCSTKGPFVYGFIDLFSGSGELWQWGLGMDENRVAASSIHSHSSYDSNVVRYEALARKVDKNVKPLTTQDTKQVHLLDRGAQLDALKEETEDENKSRSSTDSSRSEMDEQVGHAKDSENEVSNVWILLFLFNICRNYG